MNHKIKEIQFDAIFTLIKLAKYKNGTKVIKFSKSQYKLPEFISKIVNLFKK